jgi:hypothetical protein
VQQETLELLSWVSRASRSYPEAIEVWRTHCPRHSVWEDALSDGLIQVVRNGRESHVALTPVGRDALERAGAQASA